MKKASVFGVYGAMYGAFVLACLLLFSCKGEEEPTPGEIRFTIDGSKAIEGVASAIVSPVPGGEQVTIVFTNLENTLGITLVDPTTDPITNGKEYVTEDTGNLSPGVAYSKLEGGFPNVDEVYQLRSGVITVVEYDRSGKKISVEFDVVVQNLLDASKELDIKGSLLEVEILE